MLLNTYQGRIKEHHKEEEDIEGKEEEDEDGEGRGEEEKKTKSNQTSDLKLHSQNHSKMA